MQTKWLPIPFLTITFRKDYSLPFQILYLTCHPKLKMNCLINVNLMNAFQAVKKMKDSYETEY